MKKTAIWTLTIVLATLPLAGRADTTAQVPPFSQNWTNTGLITAADDWSGVPGITGFRGDDITTSTGTDPQTLLAANDPGVVDVIQNQSNPSTNTTGGVAEFEITDPVVAMQGSATADAPYLQIYLDTTGKQDVTVAYDLRDIDGAADNAVQPMALHFRVGNSGDWTNVPGAFVADASTGPSLATLVTAVSVVLPSAANNKPLVQVRIMTTNAGGSDEWIGVDNISVTATDMPPIAVSALLWGSLKALYR